MRDLIELENMCDKFIIKRVGYIPADLTCYELKDILEYIKSLENNINKTTLLTIQSDHHTKY